MASEDLYNILGVSKTATDAEIKSAYRQLAKKYHPDLYAGKPEAEKKEAEEKFKKISHAYDVLSNPEKRANYDNYGSEDGMQGGGFGGSGFSASGFGDIFGDIFGNMFGGGGAQRRANAREDGRDLTVELSISFKEG